MDDIEQIKADLMASYLAIQELQNIAEDHAARFARFKGMLENIETTFNALAEYVYERLQDQPTRTEGGLILLDK